MGSATPFVLPIEDGLALNGLLQTSSRAGRRATIVICHGFKGFMDWGFFPHLAQLLAGRGFTVVRFNFTSSGMSPGDAHVTNTSAFSSATYSRDLDELLAVLTALGETVGAQVVDRDRVGIFGHSRGGGTALLAAAHPDWSERVGALVTWSAVATFDRFSDADKRLWRQEGSIPVLNKRTGQELQLALGVLEDLERRGPELDLLAAARRRQAPWLLVHGGDDDTVPATEARELAADCLKKGWRRKALALKPFTGMLADDWFVARTGYTGEDGWEIMLPADQAAALWDCLLAAGIQPAGFCAHGRYRRLGCPE